MNTIELNRILSDEIYRLRSGRSKPEKSIAITNAARQIISAARLEMDYVKMVGNAPAAKLPFFSHHRETKALPAPKKNGKKG